MNSKQIRLLSASIGASAVVGMGALTVVFSDTSSAEPPPPPPPGPVTTSEIMTGESITETVAPEAPETPAFVPATTTPPYTITQEPA